MCTTTLNIEFSAGGDPSVDTQMACVGHYEIKLPVQEVYREKNV
jgi:hypothetical protein